jgi:hypothetical protein
MGSGSKRAAAVKITHHNSKELSALAPAPYRLLYRLDHILRFPGDSNREHKIKHIIQVNKIHPFQMATHEPRLMCKRNHSQLATKNFPDQFTVHSKEIVTIREHNIEFIATGINQQS